MLAICREGGLLRNPLCSHSLLALEQIPPLTLPPREGPDSGTVLLELASWTPGSAPKISQAQSCPLHQPGFYPQGLKSQHQGGMAGPSLKRFKLESPMAWRDLRRVFIPPPALGSRHLCP